MMAISDVELGLEPRDCVTHGPYQVKSIQAAGRHISTMSRCPVCEAERDARAQAQAQEQRAHQIEASRLDRHEKSRIPLRFKARRFDNYLAENEGQTKALNICRAYAKSWAKVSQSGAGLIFSGKAGAGKTHLACSIAHEVIEQGAVVKFATVAEIMRQIKSAFAKDATTTEQEQINYFSGIELLILDEVGMDYGTDFNKALIFEILNNRYEAMRPTLLLTNLDAPALVDYMGERLVDRMREGGGRMVSFTWDSYRAKAAKAGE